jgi:hypothetical protein
MTSNEQQAAKSSSESELFVRVRDLARQRDAVGGELSQIADRAGIAAQAARGRARSWSRLYFVVGLPAAILAAIAGATALASSALSVFAGAVALTSAALTAAATFLDSATRQTSNENLAAGWQVLSNDARMRLVVDLDNDDWLVRESRGLLQDMADRERKLLQGKAPDAEAEAERRAEIEKIRAQAEAARAEAAAERARAAEQAAQANAEAAEKGRELAAVMKATAKPAKDPPHKETL